MPVIKFQCAACGATFAVGADKAGRKGKCKHCGGSIEVPSSAPVPPAAPDEDEAAAPARRPVRSARKVRAPRPPPEPAEEEPAAESEEEPPQIEDEAAEAEDERRSRRRADAWADWRKVSLGLQLLILMAGLTLAMFILGHVGGSIYLLPGVRFGFSTYRFYFRLLLLFSLCELCGETVTLVGYGLCCWVPRRHGSGKLAGAACVLCGLTLIADLSFDLLLWKQLDAFSTGVQNITTDKNVDVQKQLSEIQEAAEDSIRFYQWEAFYLHLRYLLKGAQFLTFAFFLQGLARSLKSPAEAENCLNLIKLSVALLLVQVVVQVVLGCLLRPSSLAALGVITRLMSPLSCITGLLSLAQCAWYFLILLAVRRLVVEQARRRGKRQPA
jgi:hypothetical protein